MNLDHLLEHWKSVKVMEDTTERVIKFIFTKEDAVVETVLYRYPTYEERTVICHSVMSGCPIGCRFCGTGDYFVRNLTVEEMLEQIEFAIGYTKIRPHQMKRLQVMSMSMGEPMLNKNMIPLYEHLYDQYPKAALLLSTSGPAVDYSKFNKLAAVIPTIGLQFSVHESTDSARDKLIPYKAKLTLEQVALVGERFYERTGRKPFFNYCAGFDNSSLEDAERLLAIFNPLVWEATVSVICERDDSNGMPSTNEKQQGLARIFSSFLVDRGFNVRVFDPAGQDTIGGGCGQLWFVQKWMRENPDKAKRSIGFGKQKIHAPT